jgi:uncharacterized protein YigA (DUF484 family)
MTLQASDIAEFIKLNPEFFNDHAQLLTDVQIPHPHDGRAISIAERQLLAMREKVRFLEGKLSELLQFGQENDTILERMHRLAMALMSSRDLDALLASTEYNLREDFGVPHVTLRLWPANPAPGCAVCQPVSAELMTFAASMRQPCCGALPHPELAAWLGEQATRMGSFAVAPLRADATFGLLLLASEDARRFYPEMGTIYLARIAGLISAGLLRYLETHAPEAA